MTREVAQSSRDVARANGTDRVDGTMAQRSQHLWSPAAPEPGFVLADVDVPYPVVALNPPLATDETPQVRGVGASEIQDGGVPRILGCEPLPACGGLLGRELAPRETHLVRPGRPLPCSG